MWKLSSFPSLLPFIWVSSLSNVLTENCLNCHPSKQWPATLSWLGTRIKHFSSLWLGGHLMTWPYHPNQRSTSLGWMLHWNCHGVVVSDLIQHWHTSNTPRNPYCSICSLFMLFLRAPTYAIAGCTAAFKLFPCALANIFESKCSIINTFKKT